MSFYTISLLLLVSVIVVAALPFNNQNNDQPDSNFNNMMKKLMISMMISTSENDQANVSGVAKLGIATGSEGVEGVGGTSMVEDHDREELKSLAPSEFTNVNILLKIYGMNIINENVVLKQHTLPLVDNYSVMATMVTNGNY